MIFACNGEEPFVILHGIPVPQKGHPTWGVGIRKGSSNPILAVAMLVAVPLHFTWLPVPLMCSSHRRLWVPGTELSISTQYSYTRTLLPYFNVYLI